MVYHTEVPGLWMVETVDSFKSAQALNHRWGDRGLECGPLRIMLQVNSSGEESKYSHSSTVAVAWLCLGGEGGGGNQHVDNFTS